MKKSGVIYFNNGQRCLVRLVVSISSLRDHYDGPICVLAVGKIPDPYHTIILNFGCEIRFMPDTGERSLVRKSQLWRYTPYNVNMFLDADTFVMASIDKFFDYITEHGLVFHWFSRWRTDGRKMSSRIRQWKKVFPGNDVDNALRYGKAVNTGVFGFDNSNKRSQLFLHEWEINTRIGYKKNCTRRMVDELACQLLLPQYHHKMVGPEWGASVKFYDDKVKPIIRHYHGSKHVLDIKSCDVWKDRYWTLSTLHGLDNVRGDRRLKRYRATAQKNDVTIVTAVNPEYIDRFTENFEKWMETPGIREQEFIIFINRLSKVDKRLSFIAPHRNVRFIKWKHTPSKNNVRERMLSAFVFGVAEHVKTKYWMKLDADVTPKTRFTWPNYRDYAITAHRWGYTRVKGDPDAKRHWLNTLDWFFGGSLFPGEIGINNRHGHKRIASFCAIEETNHTRELATLCKEKNGGRLPVPSQDTTSWYYATLYNKSINRVNMKRYFSP